MNTEKYNSKTRLTITIDKNILEKAKKVAKEKRIPLSRVVENFLNFYSNPYVYCFNCGKKFYIKDAELCPKCGWMKCPYCGACGCDLDEKTAMMLYNMKRVYEDLLLGKVK